MKITKKNIIVIVIASVIISGVLSVSFKPNCHQSIVPSLVSPYVTSEVKLASQPVTSKSNLTPSLTPFGLTHQYLPIDHGKYTEGVYKHHTINWTTKKINYSIKNKNLSHLLVLNGNILKTTTTCNAKSMNKIPAFQLAFQKNQVIQFFNYGTLNTVTMLYKIPEFHMNNDGSTLSPQIDWAGLYASFTIHITANEMYIVFSARCKDFVESNWLKGNIISGPYNLTYKNNYNVNAHIFS